MSFGLGFSMPHLTKVAGAAGVVPMTIIEKQVDAQTASGGDSLGFGMSFTFANNFVSGNKVFLAYSDDANQGVGVNGQSTGISNFVQIATITSANATWFIYVCNVTAAVISPTITTAPVGNPVQYTFTALWAVSGANATVPYEASSVAVVATTGTTVQSFNATTGNANDCVLGLAYPIPTPTLVNTNTLSTFSINTSGWGPSQAAKDGILNKCFYVFGNPNIATASTTSVNALVTSQTGTGTEVLTFNIKK